MGNAQCLVLSGVHSMDLSIHVGQKENYRGSERYVMVEIYAAMPLNPQTLLPGQIVLEP